MKKLLVAIIVSGLVSVASADLYNPGNYITIVMSEEFVTPSTAYTVSVRVGTYNLDALIDPNMTVTGGTISALAINPGAGWDSFPTPNISETAGVISLEAAPGLMPILAGTELFSFTVTSDASASPITIDASSGIWAGYTAVPGPIDGYNATGPIPGSADGQYPTWTCGYKVIYAPCNYALTGDLDDNCEVNIADLAIMALNWLIDCDTDPSNPACVPK